MELEEEPFQMDSDIREVTKSHYIPKCDRDTCLNCGTNFQYPLLRRPQHCRRCGEVFCRPCLRHRRRLNVLAQLDSKGVQCKVCLKCFEERVEVIGHTRRSLTDEFKVLRKDFKEERRKLKCDVTLEVKNASVVPALWREQFQVDVLKECLRLLGGFQSAVGSSEALKTLHELKDLVNVPSWQKSMFWTLEKSATACRHCFGKLGQRKKLHNCRVCGLALCKTCSMRELLVYIEDGIKHGKNADPRIAVIKKVGCPEVEPKYSLLMYVCKECKEAILERQIKDADWFMQKPKSLDVMSQLMTMDECFRDLSQEIRKQLEQLEEHRDMGDSSTAHESTKGAVRSLIHSIQTFDISDSANETKKTTSLEEDTKRNLHTYFNLFSKLKSLPIEHKDTLQGRRQLLIQNYIKGKNTFYLEINSKFSKLWKDQ